MSIIIYRAIFLLCLIKLKSEYYFTKVNNIVGIHGEFLLSADGKDISSVYKIRGYKNALNLSEDVNGVLEFYIKDRALEGFWKIEKICTSS